MSRIVLSRYLSGEEHVVIGWDRPMSTFFWQEFNKEPRNPVTGDVEWDSPEGEEWEEMLGFAGYMYGELPTVEALIISANSNENVSSALAMAFDRLKGTLTAELQRHMTLDHPDSNIELDFSDFPNA
jgi:hypothetical protein